MESRVQRRSEHPRPARAYSVVCAELAKWDLKLFARCASPPAYTREHGSIPRFWPQVHLWTSPSNLGLGLISPGASGDGVLKRPTSHNGAKDAFPRDNPLRWDAVPGFL